MKITLTTMRALSALIMLGAWGCADTKPPTPPLIPPDGTAGTMTPGGTDMPPQGCVSDVSCQMGTICNTTTGACVPGECSLSTSCPAGQTCDFSTFRCSGSSEPACTSDANCATGFCVNGSCQNVECVNDENCQAGTRCEGMRCVADTSCIDGDADGYGQNCANGPDCDDSNPNVNPGAPENGATNCNDNVDNNCDGVDSVCGSEEDLDGDGYATKDGDCDDNNFDVNPGRTEIYYNDLDDDCDPRTNDDDQDGDGFAAEASGGPDCDDMNRGVNPSAEDIPMNGIDEDCDGRDRMITNEDRDGDGVSEAAGDCNDDDPLVNPNRPEIPYNSLDDDCDRSTPDNDLDGDGFNAPVDCDDDNRAINPNAEEIYYNGVDDDCDPTSKDGDADGDGFNSTRAGGDDCNDEVTSVNPGADEVEYNGLDDDCDPSTPDDDLDNDGFNRNVDCDDRDPAVNPDVVENAAINCSDNIDHNCVGGDVVCDAGAVDSDGDGVPDDQDCEPNNPDVPGLEEIPNNNIDDDCDGEVDFAPCDDDEFDIALSNNAPVSASAVSDGDTRYTQYGNLTLCPNDTDWYQITLNVGDGLEVDLGFDNDEGDIDVTLYRLNNGSLNEEGLTFIDDSTSVTNKEVVYTTRATTRDTYYIKVERYGVVEEAQSYQMTVNVFERCQDDPAEPGAEHNDSADEATSMPPLGAQRQICDYDDDWYRFSISETQNVRVDLLFSHSGGDLDAFLYTQGGAFIGSAVSIDDNEVIEEENLEPGDYVVRVTGFNDTQNSYRIFQTSGVIDTVEYVNDNDREIADAPAPNMPSTLEVGPIRFSEVPAGSVIRQLKIKQLDINHRCLADLSVTLKWDGAPIVTLWNREGENCLDAGLDDDSALSLGCIAGVGAAGWNGRLGNDICFENREYSEFAGLDAQGTLTVEVIDHNPENTGSVVNLQFELEYFEP